MNARRQSGNAIVIILIAVALFSALAYTLMKGGQQGTGNMSAQQAKMAAQEIINYGQTLEHAISKLRQRGCGENQLSFANTAYIKHNGTILYPDGHNPTSVPECEVFKSTGSNIQPVVLPLNYLVSWSIVGGNTEMGSARIQRWSLPQVGDTNLQDVFLTFPFIKQEVCLKFNELVGVTNPSGIPPEYSGTSAIFDGSFNGTNVLVDTNGVLTGKSAFCGSVEGSILPQKFNIMYTILSR